MLAQRQLELANHNMYPALDSLDAVRTFMRYHAFAVWDFMSLLKSLQRRLTSISIPWRPSRYPAQVVRMINEIVLGEESDLGPNGEPSSHFELYIEAMREIGAETQDILQFVSSLHDSDLPDEVRPFVQFNLALAQDGEAHRVAAAFFYGREKLIPDMFESIVRILDQHQLECPTLIYYLKRHIELDGDEHGPLAEKCLELLCPDPQSKAEAEETGLEALQLRSDLWDRVAEAIARQEHLASAPPLNLVEA